MPRDKLGFFMTGKQGITGNIISYISRVDAIHLSSITKKTHALRKTELQQICFNRLCEFLSREDIRGTKIVIENGLICLGQYPNQEELDLIISSADIFSEKKFQELMAIVTRLLYLDFLHKPVSSFMTDSFKRLLIPEMFLMPELGELIRNRLKEISQLHSQRLIKDILAALVKTTDVEIKQEMTVPFKELCKEYLALPYVNTFIYMNADLYFSYCVINKTTILNPSQYVFSQLALDDETLQFLYDKKILRFLNAKDLSPAPTHPTCLSYQSPIMMAAWRGYLKLFELTLESCWQRSHYTFLFPGDIALDYYRTPLMAAAEANQINIATKILECNDKKKMTDTLTRKDARYWNALMYASCGGHVEVINLMLKKALSIGGYELVEKLVNAYDYHQETAVIIATRSGRLAVVQGLISYVKVLNVTVNEKPQEIDQHKVALEIATKRKDEKLIALLQLYVQKPEMSSKKRCQLM